MSLSLFVWGRGPASLVTLSPGEARDFMVARPDFLCLARRQAPSGVAVADAGGPLGRDPTLKVGPEFEKVIFLPTGPLHTMSGAPLASLPSWSCNYLVLNFLPSCITFNSSQTHFEY